MTHNLQFAEVVEATADELMQTIGTHDEVY
jgi:hypothetical protein